MTTPPSLTFKILDRPSRDATGTSSHCDGMPIDRRDGYIHLSSADQLAQTLALHFAGQDDLVLLAVRTADLGQNLKWEPSRGGALFPHFYGALPMAAVAWEAPLAVAADGSCLLPQGVQ
ncbi:DUF952 domain-containing protein [Devosia rhodophyticola]|uniref:DUF952 domain-containing protein n=1 Tax=Devosia rhodophyticola TaxID=3026423 RepID=A0ABY7Z242_9HYPH|nr:DUF952 domain-containing protein [Devosia rhodophyticola]WDR07065.1 DUF952 domain-containing protein [Devosia rhodophyticola]